MEFLRFGSSIPGMYWGCCAVDIIQYFKVDPDAPASIQIVSGDSGTGQFKGGKLAFLGKTYREIFWSRLHINTFNTGEKPNHAFFAILTSAQLAGDIGKKWLAILKEAGFEFIRTTSNAVYTGAQLKTEPLTYQRNEHPNYIFGLFLNIGHGFINDPFTPPKEWTALKQVAPDASIDFGPTAAEKKKYQEATEAFQLKMWKDHPLTIYDEDEIKAAGVPVTYASQRTQKPQGTKNFREKFSKEDSLTFEINVQAEVNRRLHALGYDDAKIAAVNDAFLNIKAETESKSKKDKPVVETAPAQPKTAA